MQLEQKSEQLRSVSEQKVGMVYRRMCFVLLDSHIFVMTVVLVEQDAKLG